MSNQFPTPLTWTFDHHISVGDHRIACASPDDTRWIRRDSRWRSWIKRLAWPLANLHDELLIDGFITREVRTLLRRYVNDRTVFLEIGCGNFSLRSALPPGHTYNAFDISMSEFHLLRTSKNRTHMNLALSSADCIPLRDQTVTLMAATEVLEHIRPIDQAIGEMYRVAASNAICVVSIPNNYGIKYQKKGPHPDHCNNWTFQGFIDYMAPFGFECVHAYQKGLWIPFSYIAPSYQLPLRSSREERNTNFFYVFQVRKVKQ